MSVLIELDANGQAHVRGTPAERPAPTPAAPANTGHGDVRKRIVPIVKPPAGPSATHWGDGEYLSQSQWLEAERPTGAILLQPGDDPRTLAGRLDGVALIAVDFHRIGDGRGYSHAFWLRQRLGYQGPLRAIGTITADQVFALARVGFTQFALRADQSATAALSALSTFSVPYQGLVVAGDAQARAQAVFDARVRLLEHALAAIANDHGNVALASSLSAEDMVITDVIARLSLPIGIFTLDTGRLHAETLALVGEAERRYGLTIEVYQPDAQAVDGYVAAHGRDGFYEGVSQRKLCCNIRKVEPLNRALAGRDAWITGQRRDQVTTRGALAEAERDDQRQMAKFNPLADWSWADVLAYAERFDIPMSALYARGYVSIGCEPCTKAIRPGENPRAGRWWWEQEDGKECGLHINTTTAR